MLTLPTMSTLGGSPMAVAVPPMLENRTSAMRTCIGSSPSASDNLNHRSNGHENPGPKTNRIRNRKSMHRHASNETCRWQDFGSVHTAHKQDQRSCNKFAPRVLCDMACGGHEDIGPSGWILVLCVGTQVSRNSRDALLTNAAFEKPKRCLLGGVQWSLSWTAPAPLWWHRCDGIKGRNKPKQCHARFELSTMVFGGTKGNTEVES